MSNIDVSAEVSTNDSSDSKSDAKDVDALKLILLTDLSRPVFGDDVNILGVVCLAGVLRIKHS